MSKFILYPLRFLDLTTNLEHADQKTALLLVHGYGRTHTDWLWMRKQLSQKCQLPIFTHNLTPALGPIQHIAESLQATIDEIKAETACEEIIIISHSMGGLVSSYYSEYLDSEGLIKAVISLGTPYHGTRVAVAGAGPNAKQMEPNSTFTTDLLEHMKNSSKHYFSITSQIDNLIIPWQSTTLPFVPDSSKAIYPHESHLGLIHSDKSVEQILTWISTLQETPAFKASQKLQ